MSVLNPTINLGEGPRRRDGWFAAVAGLWLSLGLLKFGNPVILDPLVARPESFLEWVFQSWPVAWGYILLLGVLIVSWRSLRFGTEVPWWLLVLPVAWFGWQLAAATQTISPELTRLTLWHFGSCLAAFYLGVFGLSGVKRAGPFWAVLAVGFLLVMWSGFSQRYGGLEAVREFIYAQPNWEALPEEYLKKVASDRVFATLVYPNALAGAILLLLPGLAVAVWGMDRLSGAARLVGVGLLIYMGTACLYWSGSKAGWLIALALGLIALLHAPMSARIKWLMVAGVLGAGLAGFFVKFGSYFERGAPSAVARFEYWRAGWTTWKENPVFGSGPGTFSVAYQKIKPPEAEMARLAHNDYLEQGSDSGVVGFLTYAGWVLGGLIWFYQRHQGAWSPLGFAVWLGLAGWTMQGLVEFGLYVPGLAWPAFLLLGWGCGSGVRNPIDKEMKPTIISRCLT